MLMISLMMTSSLRAASSRTVSGYVVDQTSKETLIGVNVLVRGTTLGTATDLHGLFRIVGLSPGKHQLVLTHIGYAPRVVSVDLTESSLVIPDIALQPVAVEVENIVITGQRSEIADLSVETSLLEMTPQAIASIPTKRGDIFNALKHLPGVEPVDPISPLYTVRGGEPGENLILLDGVTIYNPYHFVSGSGIFNLYAVKDVEMMMGGFGAEYGGRNASVLYISTREGNNDALHGEIYPSLTSTNVVFDFPVGKNATMMVSGRMYYDLISRYLLYSPSYFYDMNVTLNWKINNHNRLSLRVFHSTDDLDYSFARFSSYFATSFDTDIFDDYDIVMKDRWHNQAATVILKTILTPNLFLKSQFSGSFFSARNDMTLDFEYAPEDADESIKLYYKTDIRNSIRDLSAKISLDWMIHPAHIWTAGVEASRYYFSNDMRLNNFGNGAAIRKPRLLAGYFEEKWIAGPLILRAGVRATQYSDMDQLTLEPRLNGILHLPHGYKLKAAWGRYSQFIVSINSQEYEISQYLDYYYPLKDRLPCESIHTILGLEKELGPHATLSLDLYYKDITRTYTLDYNLSQMEAFGFSDQIKAGTGRAYGFDLMWKGNWQGFSGWLGYGWSRAYRSFPHIMNGERLLFDYDRTHSFKVVIQHQMTPVLSYSGTFRFFTGIPKTLETAMKSYYYYDPVNNNIAWYPTYVTNRKNNARIPFGMRLDLGIKKRLRKGFGKDLADFLGADAVYMNVTLGNLLFWARRNVWMYLYYGGDKFYGMGLNYFPEFSMGYTIQF
jgi:hypothetical protein